MTGFYSENEYSTLLDKMSDHVGKRYSKLGVQDAESAKSLFRELATDPETIGFIGPDGRDLAMLHPPSGTMLFLTPDSPKNGGTMYANGLIDQLQKSMPAIDANSPAGAFQPKLVSGGIEGISADFEARHPEVARTARLTSAVMGDADTVGFADKTGQTANRTYLSEDARAVVQVRRQGWTDVTSAV